MLLNYLHLCFSRLCCGLRLWISAKSSDSHKTPATHVLISNMDTTAAEVLLQVFGCSIPGTKGRYMYGTGIISVIGTSFTFLNVTQASIGNMMVSIPFCLPFWLLQQCWCSNLQHSVTSTYAVKLQRSGIWNHAYADVLPAKTSAAAQFMHMLALLLHEAHTAKILTEGGSSYTSSSCLSCSQLSS